MFLVAAAMVSAWLITVANLPDELIALLQPFMDSPTLLLIVIMLLVIAVGLPRRLGPHRHASRTLPRLCARTACGFHLSRKSKTS